MMEVLPLPIRKMGGEAGYFKIRWKYRRKIGVDLVDAYAETGLDI
jgi:hypothetical protein